MKTKTIGFILGAALASVSSISDATPICVDQVTGDFNARPKCKKNEVALTANNLWAVLEGKSTYLSSCRTVDATDATTNGTAGASVGCNSNEFLLNYGEYVDPMTLSVSRLNKMKYEGSIPIGVFIITQLDYGVIHVPVFDTYTLHVTGTCCPRV